MTHSRLLVFVLMGAMAGSASAKSPKKSEVTHIFCPAQFVYVRTMDGDVMRPDIIPEDREAAMRVEDKLKEWGKYSLVYEPRNADLVFVVRTGRLVTERQTIGVGSPVPPGGGAGTPRGNDPSLDPSNPGQYPGAGQGQGGPRSTGGRWAGLGNEVGPPDDTLAVYQKPGDVDTQSPLWRKSIKDGLDGPSVPLFEEIRSAVDEACKDQTSEKKGPYHH